MFFSVVFLNLDHFPPPTIELHSSVLDCYRALLGALEWPCPWARLDSGNSIGLNSLDQDCTPVAFCYPSLRLARVTPGTALSVQSDIHIHRAQLSGPQNGRTDSSMYVQNFSCLDDIQRTPRSNLYCLVLIYMVDLS